jgi:hypothetical protein
MVDTLTHSHLATAVEVPQLRANLSPPRFFRPTAAVAAPFKSRIHRVSLPNPIRPPTGSTSNRGAVTLGTFFGREANSPEHAAVCYGSAGGGRSVSERPCLYAAQFTRKLIRKGGEYTSHSCSPFRQAIPLKPSSLHCSTAEVWFPSPLGTSCRYATAGGWKTVRCARSSEGGESL